MTVPYVHEPCAQVASSRSQSLSSAATLNPLARNLATSSLSSLVDKQKYNVSFSIFTR